MFKFRLNFAIMKIKIKSICIKGKLIAEIGKPRSYSLCVQILEFLGYKSHETTKLGSLEFYHVDTKEYGDDKLFMFFLDGQMCYSR